jgi:RecA-family ATPase
MSQDSPKVTIEELHEQAMNYVPDDETLEELRQLEIENNDEYWARIQEEKETKTIIRGQTRIVMNGDEWRKLDIHVDEKTLIVGTKEQPVFSVQEKMIIEAPEKSFKTTFTLPLAIGIATGTSHFGALPIVGRRRVLYLHGELSPQQLKDRLEAASKGITSLTEFYQGKDITAHLVRPQGQVAIQELLKEVEPHVLVIDPLQGFMSGCDENSFKEVSPALEFIDRLIALYKISVILNVHQGKDRDRGARGHSSLGGWRDARIVLTRSEDLVSVNVEPRWAESSQFILEFHDGTLRDTTRTTAEMRSEFARQRDNLGGYNQFAQEQRAKGVMNPTEIARLWKRV